MPLVVNEQLDLAAIIAEPADASAIIAGLSQTDAAGYAVLAGMHGVLAATPALLELIDDDGLVNRCAAWALGRLASADDLFAVINSGSLDQRELGYRALASGLALGRFDTSIEGAVRERLDQELARVRDGRTGLCEHVTRILAILGIEDLDALVQHVIDADPYTDRYELQRQRKAVDADGTDREATAEAAADWQGAFADDLLAVVESDAAEDMPTAPTEGAPAQTEPTAPPAPPVAETPAPMTPPGAHADERPLGPADDPEYPEAADDVPAEDAGDAPPMVDWQGFADSADAQALDPQIGGMIMQLGPALEQLAMRAAGVGLLDLGAQELAGLILQVLPQALPPQVVQAALSPEAINAFQAMAGWLDQQEGSSGQLVEGIRLVRSALQEQVRASGMLGGPDYSEPEAE